METFSFKISEIENQAIEKLSNQWKCTRAEAARRAIRLAHSVMLSPATTAINPEPLKEIVEGQKCIIDLLKEIAKFRPLMARINHLEEYTVQSCISAGTLVKQAGKFDSVRIEYNTWKQKRDEREE